MTFACSILLALSVAKARVPVGARFTFDTPDLTSKQNTLTVLTYWRTGLKVNGVYDNFLRLERTE